MKIPSLMDYPQYCAESEKLIMIQLQRLDCEKEIAAVDAHLAAAITSRDRVRSAALAVLDGGESSEFLDLDALREDRNDAHRRLDVLREAESIQKQRIQEAAGEATRAAGKELLPEYRKILQRMADAIVVLGRIADEEHEFRHGVQVAGFGVSAALGNPCALEPQRLSDPYSRANIWLAELEREGIKVRR